jgi:serine/threonine protein kinase
VAGHPSEARAQALEFEGNARFKVLSRLGQGGMGVVYEVFDREQNLRRALKGLRRMSADDVLRFKTEFRALRDLRHPNLVSLGELFEEDGRWFFTMELIEGVDFLTHVRERVTGDTSPVPRIALDSTTISGKHSGRDKGDTAPTLVDKPGGDAAPRPAPVPPAPPPEPVVFHQPRLRQALVQLSAGLAVLHGAGKVHRDIKSSNMLIDRNGRLVLLDFGVVAELGAGPTVEGEVVGTAAYMAPEQASGAM